MFNGYNDTPLISYEFTQERIEKKHENVPKWSYGEDTGMQPDQNQPHNRHAELWTGKSNFLGIPNVVKCNCTSCYSSTEKQSYQGDITRHRPWLPRTYPIPVNGSNESCKLPACQWDNILSNQSSCYPENSLPYGQENEEKYSYYKHRQTSRLAESNQPGVITSVKNAEFAKKIKNEISSRGQEPPVQNGTRPPVFCNQAYSLTKRVDGRNYCDPIEKYSNVASYSLDQHIPGLPVVEPFSKAVPSNLSQNRVPSTGYRSVKENMPQSYVDTGYADARKACAESEITCDQRSEAFSGVHADYSNFNHNLADAEPQKLFFDNTQHPNYYSRSNFQDAIKRNSQTLDNRKDCSMHHISEMIMSEHHYNISRTKHEEAGRAKPSCDVFYSKDLQKMRPENHPPANSACFQRNDDAKNENMNIHTRLPQSALLFNDTRFADRAQNSFTYQSSPVAYRNYIRPEYPYQDYSVQARYEYPAGLQRNDLSQYRAMPQQQLQGREQLTPQQGSGFGYDPHYQTNTEKPQELYRGKNSSPVQADTQTIENRNPTYLETIRSEELNKNGTSKISPLRLLRRKKFIKVPQEPAAVSTLDTVPGLDVRKFWSTWAEEEEESVAPTQMVVLDCQNIDPEQAKLLHLYETDPVRSIDLEMGNTVIKNTCFAKELTNQAVDREGVKTCEQLANEGKGDEELNSKGETEICVKQQEEMDKLDEINSVSLSESESKPENVESNCQKTTNKFFKRAKSRQENPGRKKAETMDKWTEKKFDFLKRAEESKAAEVLRHEEEKKKIFETRLSLQHGLKKNENPKNIKKGEESLSEKLPPFDENSQTNSPNDITGSVTDLPTSEYRRNKFLDYSDRKLIENGEDKIERCEVVNGSSHTSDEPTEFCELKKEKNECSDKWLDKHSSDKLFPSLNSKFKEEVGFEMDDILKRMSEINFQCSDVKVENGLDHSNRKKFKSARKPKRRKSDHQPENEERTDRLTVETVTKPTIKFSIQKSHDLKISFKVLNSSKEYSDEDVEGEGTEEKAKTMEDSKNSTELITLKYKSIKRDGEDLKKSRRAFRRKKQIPKMKTPVLKIKKSRYAPEEERDPLANDGEGDDDPLEKCSDSDGVQVKETMDSAKIKLTFKRHKGNFETEYKINSNNIEKDLDIESGHEEKEEKVELASDKCKKQSRRSEEHEIFTEAGVETFKDCPEPEVVGNDVENERKPDFESILEEYSRNPLTSRDSYFKKEKCDSHSDRSVFPSFPSEPQFPLHTPENEEKLNIYETGKRDGMDSLIVDSKWNDNKCGSDLVDFALNDVINCKEDNISEEKFSELPLLGSNSSPDVGLKQLTRDEFGPVDEGKEETKTFEEVEILEISFDFIGSVESQEIKIGKSIENDIPDMENCGKESKEKQRSSENQNEIKTPETEERCYTLTSEKGEDCALKNCEITTIGSDSDSVLAGVRSPANISQECLDLEGVTRVKNSALEEQGGGVHNEKIPEALTILKDTKTFAAEEEADDRNCENSSLQLEFYENSLVDLDATDVDSSNLFEKLSRDDSKCDLESSKPQMSTKYISSTNVKSPNEVECKKPNENVGKLPRDSTQSEDPRTDLEVLLEKSVDNSERTVFERPEAVVEKSSIAGCCLLENSNSFLSLKNDLEIEFRLAKVGFLPAANTGPESLVPAVQVVQSSSSCAAQYEDDTYCSLFSPSKSVSVETASEDTNNPSTEVEQSESRTDNREKNENHEKSKAEVTESISFLPEVKDLGRSAVEYDSGCVEGSFSPEEDTPSVLNDNEKLEDGEIIYIEPEGRSPEEEQTHVHPFDIFPNVRKSFEFVVRKIERRNSINPEKPNRQRKSQITWSRKKFSKAKSCPPEFVFSELQLDKEEAPLYIPVETIPLPVGPAPYENCCDLTKYMNECSTRTNCTEAKEKPRKTRTSNFPKRLLADLPQCKSFLGSSDLEKGQNYSSPVNYIEGRPGLRILERSSKIKFSFLKRSKFSKMDLKTAKHSKLPNQGQDNQAEKSENFKIGGPGFVQAEHAAIPKECQIVEVPNNNVPAGIKETKHSENLKSVSEKLVGLSCEDLDENVEVIDAMNGFMREEFYECEDIPTSEDPEIEKVNDDKFRNIMQNCLDNAKKFLNVGNLKLFSCSVDDLLEFDCQVSESSLRENSPEKPNNHISRDVLLTSCEETNDELGFSENIQAADISMDFVPSFCSEVCPEILPVDNWPYLEEEVPSSPNKMKPDETDLIPTLENAPEGPVSHKNGIERRRRKGVASETSLKRLRRKSLVSDEEDRRMCSKIGIQRRKTIDSFSGASYGKDILDLKSDIMRLKNGADEAKNKSLKCRLSLDKITSKHGINFGFKNERLPKNPEIGAKIKNTRNLDYRSPSWQPKVILFRISKNELREVLKSSKTHKRFPSKTSGDSTKRKISCDLGNKVAYAIKKPKSDPEFEKYVKTVQEFGEVMGTIDKGNLNEQKLIDLSKLESIKGSLTSGGPDLRKRKKSRFRNLHTKRRIEPDSTRDTNSSAESSSPTEPTLVDAETIFSDDFQDCDCVSNPQNKNPKLINIKNGEQKLKKKPRDSENRLHWSSKRERRSHNSAETTSSTSKKEWKQETHREKPERTLDYRDRRREKSNGSELNKQEEKTTESEGRKYNRHGSSHDLTKHQTKRSPSGSKHLKNKPERRNLERCSSGVGKKWRSEESSPEASWMCEVCGFNEASERMVHIKSHPFHCQSCHLAFKTETHFISHLTKSHKDIRNQHHCLLCELSFDTEDQYQIHLETREHRHLESVEKNTINTLFTLLTGAPCPVLGLVEMRPEWLPSQAGTVHFYHQATPLSLALQSYQQRWKNWLENKDKNV